MNWVRIDVRLFRHPKLALCPFEATGLFILYIAHCGEFETDGRFPVAQAKRIAQSAGADPEMIKYLLDAQVIAQDGEYYQIHDYADYNPTKGQIEATSKERAVAGRAGGIRSGESRRAAAEAKSKQIASHLVERSFKQNGSTSTIRNDNDRNRGLKSSIRHAHDARVDEVIDAFGLTLTDATYEGMEEVCHRPEFAGLDWVAIATRAIDAVTAKGEKIRSPKKLMETCLLNETKKPLNGRTMDAAEIEERERLKWEAQANDPMVKAGHERLQKQKRERLAREQAAKERMEEERESTE